MASKLQVVLLVALLAVLFRAVQSGRVLHETESSPSAPSFEAAGAHPSSATTPHQPADTRADSEYKRSLAARELSVTIEGDAFRGVAKRRTLPPPPPLNPYHP